MNTAKNKPCRLCKKRRKTCHVHSPSSVSPKNESTNYEIEYIDSPTKLKDIEKLPFPVLERILLNMEDRKLLAIVCSKSENAKRICAERNFQQKYLAKYPPIYIDREEGFSFVNYVDGFYFESGNVHILIGNTDRWGNFSVNWRNGKLSEWFYSDQNLDIRPSNQKAKMTDLYNYLSEKDDQEIIEYMKTKNWKAIIG